MEVGEKSRSKIQTLILILFMMIFVSIIGVHIPYAPNFFFASYFKGIVNAVQLETLHVHLINWDIVLRKLYYLYPNISWLSWLFILYTHTAIFILLYSLITVIKKIELSTSLIFMFSIVSIWLIIVFYIGLTRTPFYVAGAAILFLIVSDRQNDIIKTLCLSVLVAGASFIRFESMLAASVVLLPCLIFVFFNNRKKFRSVLLSTILVFSLGFICFIAHSYKYNNPEDKLMREFYSTHFNFFDAHQRAIAHTPEDSIRLEAMAMDFNVDRVKLNIDEYKRLTTGNILKMNGMENLKSKFHRLAVNLPNVFEANKHILSIYLLLIIAVVFVCYRDKKNLFLLFINQLWIASVIIGIVFFIKYANHFIQPIIVLSTISILVCLFYAKKSFFYFKSNIVKAVFFLFLYLGFKDFYYFNYKERNEIRDLNISNLQAIASLSKIQKEENKDLIFTVDGYNLFQTGILNEVSSNDIIIYTYDSHNGYLHGMAKAVEKYCGCNTLTGFYQHIVEEKNAPIIVASEERINMMKDYFRILYNYSFEVKDMTNEYSNPLAFKRVNLHLYTLTKFQKL